MSRNLAAYPLVLLLVFSLPAPHLAAQDPDGDSGQAADPAPEPTMQGLPPAPPPTGIRPSRAEAERRRWVRQPEATVPRRATSSALELALTIEVRGIERERADAALRAAVETVRELEELVDLRGEAPDGLAALNAAGGGEPVILDPRLVEMLERALSFCEWSKGVHGPLGGELYSIWGLRTPAPARPTPSRVKRAAEGAACDHLRIDSASGKVQLATGSLVDPWGFATGWLVDGAMETLLDLGVENAFVELGWVRRAAGSRVQSPVDGPLAAYRGDDGNRGWPVTLPDFPGREEPLDTVWLRDDSLSVTSALHRPIRLAGDRYPPWIDQSTGVPAIGVTAAIAVTETALDAHALAASMLIMGNREGMARAGGLKPKPSVLWLLGRGQGTPVLSNYNWSDVALR